MRKGLTYSEAGKLGATKTNIIQKKKKRKKIYAYNKKPSLCKCCKNSLPYIKRNNKFCNHSCAASFNNIGTVRNGVLRRKECLNCTIITANFKYCSHKCEKTYKWEERKKKIEEKKEILGRVDKRYLIETRGNKCEICGVEQWQDKKLVMIMDHIDGNSTNNFLSNLRLVCPNCDSQLPTYKSKNKGNGRYYRRVRYFESKSF